MARKFKLNEDKFKVAFIFANEGCNPKKDRSIIESEKIIMYVSDVLITVRQKL